MEAKRSNKLKRGLSHKTRKPQLLVDMRKVYDGEESSSTTPGHGALLAMLTNEPAKFIERMCRLEEAHVRRQEANRIMRPDDDAAQEVASDEGELKVLGAVEGLLEEWETKN